MLASYISSQIYTNFYFEPTFEQKKVIEIIAEYVSQSSSGDILIVDGHAGTGKTTIISALIKTLDKFEINSCMLAPTGRAAKVMAYISSKEAFTIHKKIYIQRSALIESFVLDINKSKNTYFIVDEASMISTNNYDNNIFGSGNLLEDLIDYVGSGKDCRLIIVGDSAQLPPVGHTDSPALDERYMQRYGRVTKVSLKEVMRQQMDSGILYNANIIRELIDRQCNEIPKFDLSFDDFRQISGADFLDEIDTAYSKYGSDETIVITRSNKQANRFNQGIRQRVIYQDEEISSGDRVMVVKNNYHFVSEDSSLGFIANGEVAEIRRIRRYEEMYGFRFIEATLKFPNYDNIEIECKVNIDTLYSDSPSLTQEQNRSLFELVEKDYAHERTKKERYKKIREDDFFNALQIKFAYAVTCHKAQGGQWECVFIDRMLFGEELMNRDFQRWLYTAVTRAKTKLFLVNFDQRFFDEDISGF